MGLFDVLLKKEDDSFVEWIKNASTEELNVGYEKRRLVWLKNGENGNREKTLEMKLLEKEIS